MRHRIPSIHLILFKDLTKTKAFSIGNLKIPGRNKLSLHSTADAYCTLLLGTGPHCVANSSLELLAELR